MKISVIRSNRKTIAIQVKTDLTVTVRAPKTVSDREIAQFLKEKENWIQQSLEKLREKQAMYEQEEVTPFSYEEVQEMAERAVAYIPKRVAHFASQMGVNYGRITIRNQKTRWGSCSGKGNLNFNCLLMLAPPEVIDYVVVHELCHRKEMNHSKAFWAEVEQILPDYKKQVQWLKNEGSAIIRRNRGT